MAYKAFITTSIVLSAAFSLTSAANCNTAQFRKDGDPSGQKISDALRGTNGATTLNSVCNGGFPPGSDTIATFNTGSLIYNITRTDPNKPIENCEDGFQNIIQQCILDSNYWGGDWELDGITYAIYDQSWPDHILPSDLQSSTSVGAKTASSDAATTPASTSAAMETAISTISRATPSGQTVIVATINGSPVTETFVPTTVSGITAATTTSTTIDGVIVPLILGPLGIGLIPFIPPGGVPPVPDFTPPPAPGDGGNDPCPTVTKSASQTSSQASTSSTSSASSRGPISQNLDDGYNVGTCGRDGGAAGRTTTFKTSGSTSKPTTPTSTSTAVRFTTIPKVTPSSTSTTATAVFPSSTGINCGQSASGGTRLADCLNALSSVLIPNDSTLICTNTDKCINSGQSVGGDPLVTTSNFCTVGGNGGCSVVIANKLSSFGFPGFSCVTGADLNLFIKNAANQCNNGLDAYAIAQGPNQYDSLCLTSADDPGLCGA